MDVWMTILPCILMDITLLRAAALLWKNMVHQRRERVPLPFIVPDCLFGLLVLAPLHARLFSSVFKPTSRPFFFLDAYSQSRTSKRGCVRQSVGSAFIKKSGEMKWNLQCRNNALEGVWVRLSVSRLVCWSVSNLLFTTRLNIEKQHFWS